MGNNILANQSFNKLYNSSNIEKIKGNSFNYLICSGAPGTQWFANKYPEKDFDSITRLKNCLQKVKVEKLILISTIAVYHNPIMVDETSLIDDTKLLPYGYNRYNLERFIQDEFDAIIIRLPALFGKGLKKNIIFDLINKKYTDNINADSLYQFYNLSNLSNDIKLAKKNKIKKLNLATEPIKIIELVNRCLNYNIVLNKNALKREENMLSKHGNIWGSETNYLYSKIDVLGDLKYFMKFKQLRNSNG